MKRFVPAKIGAPLLGYDSTTQGMQRFYRAVRDGNLSTRYYERRGKRIYVSLEALGLTSSPGGEEEEKAQDQGNRLQAVDQIRA